MSHIRLAPLRIGIAQFKPAKARVRQNLDRIREWIGDAADECDLLIFPETATSGYFVEGGVAEVARSATELAESLGTPPADSPDVVIGFYERWRGRLYNSAVHLSPGAAEYDIVHVHRKMFLPTYGVFQEGRFVEAGRDVRPYDTRFGRLGMLVCEEAWHSLPPTVLAVGGADAILILSASPAREFAARHPERPSNLEVWDRLGTGIAAEHGVFVVVSQLVGSEGGKLFAGGSIVANPEGRIAVRGPLLEEGCVTTSLDPSEIQRVRAQSPLLADLEAVLPHLRRSLGREAESGGDETSDIPKMHGGVGAEPRETGPPDPEDPTVLDLNLELVESALVEFLREELVVQRGFERAVVGVSGGVDSAVTLFLACRALGPENVHGFKLPYATSSTESLTHADLALDATGAHGRTIAITDAVDGYVNGFETDLSPLRRGNLAARTRALILFDQSAKLSGLPIGTGNKSERLLGYFTWHADDSPPINPLGDLFKSQVWALARHLGVPSEIVEKPASADLVRGVHDEDELGISYPKADLILHWILRGYGTETLTARGFDPDEVDIVRRRLESTHWKRRLPTVAMLSSSAIGEFYLRPVDY